MEKLEQNSIREDFHKEMDMVQSCINRMAQNSFIIKGWLLTLLGVIFSIMFSKEEDMVSICLILLIPVFCFWYLDAFFLMTERLYRKKYEWIIHERPKGNQTYLYDMNPHNKNMWRGNPEKPRIVKVMFSKTLLPFYLMPILILMLLLINVLMR